MNIIRTKEFDALFVKMPKDIQNRIIKQLTILLQNPMHPSLRKHKMEGYTHRGEISVSKSYRITFDQEGEDYILRRVGPHDILDKS